MHSPVGRETSFALHGDAVDVVETQTPEAFFE